MLLPTLLFGTACAASAAASSSAVAKRDGPPSFFLQDMSDGTCLGGGQFKRCSIDALWYVSGKPGHYKLHKKGQDDDDHHSGEEGLCLDRTVCDTESSDVRVGSCEHCGASGWSINGDAKTGYQLSQGGLTRCLTREGKRARMEPCPKPAGTSLHLLQLQFVSREDLALMSSPGAKMITAVSCVPVALGLANTAAEATEPTKKW